MIHTCRRPRNTVRGRRLRFGIFPPPMDFSLLSEIMKSFIQLFVRSRRALLAAPVVLVIASAALVRPGPSEVHADSPAGLNEGTPVSPTVMAVLQRACLYGKTLRKG